MAIPCDEIICNEIEQGLSYILGDLVIMKHARLLIFGIIMSSSEYVISCISQSPVKM